MDERRRRMSVSRHRLAAPFYDHFRPRTRFREEAIGRLQLAPGQTVLDMGCGTGLSFELIQEQIGSQGRIIGAELSPDMLARARQKVTAHGWQNVTLIEAAAEEADIPGEADAALFYFTHDIMQSETALTNALSHLKESGRVVAAGAKRPSRWWQLPANLAVLLIYWPFATTTAGRARPWDKLEHLLPELRVEERSFGTMYMAYGSKWQVSRSIRRKPAK